MDYLDFCVQCPLHKSRTNLVPGAGPSPSNLMLIGEGPGQQEDIQGVPFVGRAGQLLTSILLSVGIRREDIYITNIVKCRPPQNRNPEEKEVLACRTYLVNQLLVLKPKIIILVGSPALKAVLDKTISITKARGQWFFQKVPYMQEELAIMPVFHPSYLLRNASREVGGPKWLTWQDMKAIKTVIEERSLL
ncbi:MAG: hypothetical protein A2X42_00255 [Candidatus Margulisbacteria bacterium GWF2_38_17]|nr:MAG: hypothetical protein A2X43_08795 [Candidatus Margulisbacteria bacterium GWD2_39_127]OGI02681.1 MAG: hypothetical protein A2X42_00255 [Candidatus Margulisbacteria bacterium GWF2_38_17]OGI05958.1 MAG: hypothetical protein A2X41_07730 [Candidatus Margulisbacteria bacterium GWE2_39_32]